MKKKNTELGITPIGNVVNVQEAYRNGLISMVERDAAIKRYEKKGGKENEQTRSKQESSKQRSICDKQNQMVQKYWF